MLLFNYKDFKISSKTKWYASILAEYRLCVFVGKRGMLNFSEGLTLQCVWHLHYIYVQ